MSHLLPSPSPRRQPALTLPSTHPRLALPLQGCSSLTLPSPCSYNLSYLPYTMILPSLITLKPFIRLHPSRIPPSSGPLSSLALLLYLPHPAFIPSLPSPSSVLHRHPFSHPFLLSPSSIPHLTLTLPHFLPPLPFLPHFPLTLPSTSHHFVPPHIRPSQLLLEYFDFFVVYV